MFFVYFIGLVIIFIVDKMISMSRKKIELNVIRVEKFFLGMIMGFNLGFVWWWFWVVEFMNGGLYFWWLLRFVWFCVLLFWFVR